jgi:predicted ester cyclase
MTPDEVVLMQFEDFNNRTYRENAAKYIAPHAVFFDQPTGRQGQGVAAFIESSDGWVSAFSDAWVDVISQEVDGNTVRTYFVGRGTFDGQMPAPDGTMIPGNGRALEMEFFSETVVENGFIVQDSSNYDLQAMMRQLGLM